MRERHGKEGRRNELEMHVQADNDIEPSAGEHGLYLKCSQSSIYWERSPNS